MSIRVAFVVLTAISSVVSVILASMLVMTIAHVTLTIALVLRLLVVVAVVLVVALWVGYAFAQPIRRRLYEIEEGAVLLASGRLQHRVNLMGNGDEIDQLGHQFNEMGEKLEAQVKVLQNLADENKRLAAESERGAVLNERQRLARELHDSVSQQLFALTMLSATAQRYFTNNAPQLENTLEQMNTLANAAQREMRALLLHLRPVELDGRSLHEACEGFLAAIQDRHGLKVRFDDRLTETISPAVEQQLFRILQEAAANVLKHAQATSLNVAVSGDERYVEMTVRDNGIGIDGRDTAETSYGIQSMRERAAALGGSFDIWQRAQGTALKVTIPTVKERVAQDGGE